MVHPVSAELGVEWERRQVAAELGRWSCAVWMQMGTRDEEGKEYTAGLGAMDLRPSTLILYEAGNSTVETIVTFSVASLWNHHLLQRVRLRRSDASSYSNSYQAGGNLADPTSVPQAYSNDPESAAFVGAGGSGQANGSGNGDERANAWESRFGWRVDLMAAAAYLGGPVTGT